MKDSKASPVESAISSDKIGWFIVFVAFLTDALSMGGRSIFLVVIVIWESHFGWSRAELSNLMVLVHCMNGIVTPLSGHLVDLLPGSIVIGFGIAFLALSFTCVSFIHESWHIWLIYGVMCGSAYGFLNLNVFVVAVTRAISEARQGLAVGIASSGSTAGQLALVPVFVIVSNIYGWRNSFLFLGACVWLLLFPAVALLRYNESRNESKKENSIEIVIVNENDNDSQNQCEEKISDDTNENEDEDVDVWQRVYLLIVNPSYWILTLVFVICGITTTGFIETHFVALAVDRGESLSIAALAFSVLSATNGFAMILAGYLTDLTDRYIILAVIFLLRTIAYAILLCFSTQPMLFTFASLFGIADYSVVPPVCSLVQSFAEADRVDYTGLGVGILLLWHSLGAALGAWLGGAAYSDDGNYTNALISCIALCAFASFILGLMPVFIGGGMRHPVVHEKENQSGLGNND
jgi:predicted MFS family arabinose efflux permease